MRFRPARDAARVRCPVLAQLAAADRVVPGHSTRRALRKLPQAEVRTVAGGHFAPFSGAGFQETTAAEVAFLRQHLVDGPAQQPDEAEEPDHEVIVVGGGFSGIGAAIALAEAGIDDVLVVEDGDGVGGAWHWNTYPGVAVDIPSFCYQFSYDQRKDWSRVYAPGSELKSYAESLVDRHGVRSKLRLNTRVVAAEFSDHSHTWRLTTRAGDQLTARYVVGATGILTQPKLPDIAGVGDFAGTTLHTARWDHSVDLRGKRVAVIGTGASAVQLIPSIAPDVTHLTVFQRTPIWCLPKPDAPLPPPARLALRLPGTMLAMRMLSHAYVELTFILAAHYATVFPIAKLGEKLGRRHLRAVHDPETRAKLTPSYTLGCKRPSFHNTYLPTFNRPNVTLETTPIDRIEPDAVVTADGTRHEIDVLVLATGFKVFEPGNMPPFSTKGSGGIDLNDFWQTHRYQSYQGVSVPGFPNLFTILGPYGYNGASYFTFIEHQMNHIVRCITQGRSRGATRIEITQQAHDAYFAQMLSRRDKQVFFTGACGTANSYYFDATHGDAPIRASSTPEAVWTSGHYELDAYRFDGVTHQPERTPS
jgi:cation diffusion facilitator CzcD-associated flavoprotein CzcO